MNNLNAALEGKGQPDVPVEQLIAKIDALPEALRTPVRNNGGGHANHSLFWTVMSPQDGGQPDGALAQTIDKDLGGYDSFKDAFTKAALTRFGHGWAWLTVDRQDKLAIESTGNQDSPLMEGIGSGNTAGARTGRVGARLLSEV